MKEQSMQWCTNEKLQQLNKEGYVVVQVIAHKQVSAYNGYYHETPVDHCLCLLEREEQP